jgi:hypothetical protein
VFAIGVGGDLRVRNGDGRRKQRGAEHRAAEEFATIEHE